MMAYEIKILKISVFDIAKAAVGETSDKPPVFRIVFEGDDDSTYIEVASPPLTALEAVEELFKVYGDDDMYAGVTNVLDQIKDGRIDILVGEEEVPYGEFSHLYEGA